MYLPMLKALMPQENLSCLKNMAPVVKQAVPVALLQGQRSSSSQEKNLLCCTCWWRYVCSLREGPGICRNRFALLALEVNSHNANFNAHSQILAWRWTKHRLWVPTRSCYCMPLWTVTTACTIPDPPVTVEWESRSIFSPSDFLPPCWNFLPICLPPARPYSCSLLVPCYVDGGGRKKSTISAFLYAKSTAVSACLNLSALQLLSRTLVPQTAWGHF